MRNGTLEKVTSFGDLTLILNEIFSNNLQGASEALSPMPRIGLKRKRRNVAQKELL